MCPFINDQIWYCETNLAWNILKCNIKQIYLNAIVNIKQDNLTYVSLVNTIELNVLIYQNQLVKVIV